MALPTRYVALDEGKEIIKEVKTSTLPFPKTVRVLALDMDGCALPNIPVSIKRGVETAASTRNRLIDENRVFLDLAANLINETLADEVIITSFSNRQNKHFDDSNAKVNRRDKSTIALPLIANELEKRMKKQNLSAKCMLDLFWLADIFGPQITRAGESFENALAQDIEKNSNYTHANSIWDNSKCLLVYALAHRYKAIYPEASITIEIIEDRKDIIKGIEDFFFSHPQLLPNVFIQFSPYNSHHNYPDSDTFHPQTIQGLGPTNRHYGWGLRALAIKKLQQNEKRIISIVHLPLKFINFIR